MAFYARSLSFSRFKSFPCVSMPPLYRLLVVVYLCAILCSSDFSYLFFSISVNNWRKKIMKTISSFSGIRLFSLFVLVCSVRSSLLFAGYKFTIVLLEWNLSILLHVAGIEFCSCTCASVLLMLTFIWIIRRLQFCRSISMLLQ